MSSKHSDETRTMHTKRNNIEITIGNEAVQIIRELFEFLLQRYQEGLEESTRGSEFFLHNIDLLCYTLHKISLNRGRSYVDSPKWLKNKKARINPKNSDENCFQYAVAVALNYQKIKNNPERISKIKSFIDQYNWKEINFPSNNKSVALNILYVSYDTEETRHVYESKHNSLLENQVNLLMITDGEKWHYLNVKKIASVTYRNNIKTWWRFLLFKLLSFVENKK